MASNPVTLYKHKADLSLCYPLMFNDRPGATSVTAFFKSSGANQPRNKPRITIHGADILTAKIIDPQQTVRFSAGLDQKQNAFVGAFINYLLS